MKGYLNSMDENTPITPVVLSDEDLSFWQRHRISLLLIITVFVALTLTVISVVIYNNSGAAQLDFSRPGIRSVSDKVQKTDAIDTYSAAGEVNKNAIEQFIKLYDAQASKAKAVDAFNGDPLNPQVLEFGTQTAE